jgi:hypothetical protein
MRPHWLVHGDSLELDLATTGGIEHGERTGDDSTVAA